jgi:VWFA-related protein
LALVSAAAALQAQQAPEQTVPDSPTPQSSPLAGIKKEVAPGKGQTAKDADASSSVADTVPATSTNKAQPEVQTAPPEQPKAGEAYEIIKNAININVNYVDLPVTVKDTKGHLVAGLTYRDFKVYENGIREPLRMFSVDPMPLSIVFVVDQSVTSDVMAKVNESLSSIQGALTPYDELAIYSYNNGAQDRSHGFTGAQSQRVAYVISMTKNTGRDMLVPNGGGPFDSCPIHQNGGCVDPNIQAGFSAGAINGDNTIYPKEPHTLNDAILAAARELSTREKGRRRLIYVISDGKEYGSKASYKEVLRYLQTNKIAIYGTLVGDSARWGEGYLSRFHIPGTMNENILIKYAQSTGGTLDAEASVNGIVRSYGKIAEEARTQYTLGYISHQPVLDSKFRAIDVRVERPGLEVIAKRGYYPSAQDVK